MPGSSLWLIPPPNSLLNRQLHTQISSLVPLRFHGLKPPSFIPHVTLTSNIDAGVYGTDGQAWLDSLDLPTATASQSGIEHGRTQAVRTLERPVDPLDEKAALERGERSDTTEKEPADDAEAEAMPSDHAPPASGADRLEQSVSHGPVEVDLHSLAAGDPFFRKLTLLAREPCPALRALAVACRAQGVYRGDYEAARSWADDEYGPHLSLMYADLPRKEVQKMVPAVLQDLERARAIIKPARDGTVATGGRIVLVPTDRPIGQWMPIASREVPSLVWKWTGT